LKGFDNHKKVKGRKRHIIVDVEGNLLVVVVHSAGVQDFHGARQALEKLAQRHWPRLKKILADAIYKGDRYLADWIMETFGWEIEVVEREPGTKGFQVLPKRWVVERTFAWMGRNRRLSKEYDLLPETSETWMYIAMTALLTRRLAAAS
jgi:putative transposase